MVSSDADAAFRALADRHRRQLLLALLSHTPQDEVSVPDDVPLDRAETDELRSELHHVHLPMLERHGFVEWDRQAKTVGRGPAYDEIRPLLEWIDRNRDELPADWF